MSIWSQTNSTTKKRRAIADLQYASRWIWNIRSVSKMFDGDDKILTENTCCLCLNDDESTFSATTIMKSLPLHEMVNFCIGIEVGNVINQIEFHRMHQFHRFHSWLGPNRITNCSNCPRYATSAYFTSATSTRSSREFWRPRKRWPNVPKAKDAAIYSKRIVMKRVPHTRTWPEMRQIKTKK